MSVSVAKLKIAIIVQLQIHVNYVKKIVKIMNLMEINVIQYVLQTAKVVIFHTNVLYVNQILVLIKLKDVHHATILIALIV